MVVVAESPLSSLAMVKVNWDRGNDYIDNFVPFVEEAFRRARHDEVAIEDLQVSIFDLFGLRIPQGALQTIIRRLVKRGVLKRAQGLIRRLPSKLGDGSFDADRDHATRQIATIVTELRGFARAEFDSEWTGEKAELALFQFLERDGSAVLRALTVGDILEAPPTGSIRNDYLVGRFISKVIVADGATATALETVVKGAMLVSALLYPELGSIQRGLDGLTVYFDTRFLIEALGLVDEGLLVCEKGHGERGTAYGYHRADPTVELELEVASGE